MLRLLALAAGAYWLRKPENRKLAEDKLKEAWNRVMHGPDKRKQDIRPYQTSQRPNPERDQDL
ncbi:hypothetical protein [Halomonas chromatireducens]|uniref:Uncharacterized protein n=1 Tax=Halomonas chromatireducens TaxID=507626 RepID=A0A120JVX5_9GAMM|nr:hypothetical protein [Halomonas chromatireducens]AMD00533.1 hypothetical protein LOKO_01465 [Halomonas chromatireducens]